MFAFCGVRAPQNANISKSLPLARPPPTATGRAGDQVLCPVCHPYIPGDLERGDTVQTQDIEQGLPETVSLLDRLRIAIYRGELAPGQRLVESELAQKYDTSRGAVREALALLQNEGLVTRQRNRSAWVRPV